MVENEQCQETHNNLFHSLKKVTSYNLPKTNDVNSEYLNIVVGIINVTTSRSLGVFREQIPALQRRSSFSVGPKGR